MQILKTFLLPVLAIVVLMLGVLWLTRPSTESEPETTTRSDVASPTTSSLQGGTAGALKPGSTSSAGFQGAPGVVQGGSAGQGALQSVQ